MSRRLDSPGHGSTGARGWLVVIDDPGRRALHAHRQARREIFHELLCDLDTDGLAITATVLERLAERIDALTADQP